MADIKKVNNNFFIEDQGEMVAEIHFVPTGLMFQTSFEVKEQGKNWSKEW
jgi:hypothetical protein